MITPVCTTVTETITRGSGQSFNTYSLFQYKHLRPRRTIQMTPASLHREEKQKQQQNNSSADHEIVAGFFLYKTVLTSVSIETLLYIKTPNLIVLIEMFIRTTCPR